MVKADDRYGSAFCPVATLMQICELDTTKTLTRLAYFDIVAVFSSIGAAVQALYADRIKNLIR